MAPRGRAGRRQAPRLRRVRARLRPHSLRCLHARISARVLVHVPLLLSELSCPSASRSGRRGWTRHCSCRRRSRRIRDRPQSNFLPSNGARGQSSGITLAFSSARSHGWRAERATDYARLHQASLCSNLAHRRIRLWLWDGHTLRAKPFEMKLASRIVRSTASRVAPVATQPGTSGAYAEHPEAVCSTTIRSFMTSALPA